MYIHACGEKRTLEFPAPGQNCTILILHHGYTTLIRPLCRERTTMFMFSISGITMGKMLSKLAKTRRSRLQSAAFCSSSYSISFPCFQISNSVLLQTGEPRFAAEERF